jgi:hypothetical protein
MVCDQERGEGKTKLRLIADCRELNHYFCPKHFRLDQWASIFPTLRKGMWGAKVDLKHAYFHLGLANELRPYVCLKVDQEVYQFQAAAFGLSPLPQLWQMVMKTFQKMWRSKGLMVWIYLDDIFLVAQSPSMVAKHLEMVLNDLKAAGMVINEKKSILTPTQLVEHLGFLVDLKQGLLSVPPGKLKMIQKELGKLLTHSTLSCRKMAAILGTTRSFLTAIPCLRAFTDQMVHFVKKQQRGGWDSSFPLPEALKSQIKEIKVLLDSWKGRIFQGQAIVRTLHSDSSQHAWAGVDLTSNQIVHEFWRTENGLHINVKELRAAINTVKSLAKKGEKVALAVDNSVTYAYLKNGGGRVPSLNAILRPFLKWCLENQIQLEINQVSSKEDLADAPSRWQMDKGDYTLNRDLFLALLRKIRNFDKPQFTCLLPQEIINSPRL